MLMALESYESWTPRAKCSGLNPDFFYAEKKDDIVRAKKFCRDCPVVNPCKLYALVHGEKGVWGGTSHHERQNSLGRGGVRQILIDLYRQEGVLEERPAIR